MFSDRESKILKILKRKQMTYEQIAEKLFKMNLDMPIDANISVANSVTKIIKKCDYHGLKWTLTKRRKLNKLVIKRAKK